MPWEQKRDPTIPRRKKQQRIGDLPSLTAVILEEMNISPLTQSTREWSG